jgi:hypothetical protein
MVKGRSEYDQSNSYFCMYENRITKPIKIVLKSGEVE